MTRLRRFENLEKTRPGGSETPARSPRVTDRFGSAHDAAPSAAPEPAPAGNGRPERFGDAPARGAALRVREPDEGQPFVRCASCRADGHVTSVVCSHCGADLTTREQRVYNESVWRQQQAEKAEQQQEIAKLEAAREQAEREAAEAHRQLDELIRQRRNRAGRTVADAEAVLRARSRGLADALGAWLRRLFPNRIHRIAFGVAGGLALGGLVAFVMTSPSLRGGLLTTIVVAGLVAGLIERFRRFGRS